MAVLQTLVKPAIAVGGQKAPTDSYLCDAMPLVGRCIKCSFNGVLASQADMRGLHCWSERANRSRRRLRGGHFAALRRNDFPNR
ncbi:hypothetical protein [Henriciella sp.]|uniref:hypothetical protein n=1 Tax=Henriciella sp. TaxID=1968823 RepID=UPI00262DD1C7|nr:hypothetical protein [Henriciella sp.]